MPRQLLFPSAKFRLNKLPHTLGSVFHRNQLESFRRCPQWDNQSKFFSKSLESHDMISNSITQTFHVPWGTKEIGDNCGQATCTSKFAPNFSWPYCSCQQPAYTCPALAHTNVMNQNYWKNSLKQLKNLKGEPTKHFHVCRFIFCDLAPVVLVVLSWNWLRVQWIVSSTFWTSMPRWLSYLNNISRVWRASSPTHIGNLREYP